MAISIEALSTRIPLIHKVHKGESAAMGSDVTGLLDYYRSGVALTAGELLKISPHLRPENAYARTSLYMPPSLPGPRLHMGQVVSGLAEVGKWVVYGAAAFVTVSSMVRGAYQYPQNIFPFMR